MTEITSLNRYDLCLCEHPRNKHSYRSQCEECSCQLFREKIRTDLAQFTLAIEYVLRGHDEQKGDSYKTCDLKFLFDKHAEEYDEVTSLKDAYPHDKDDPDGETFIAGSLSRELLDEAAICMMLWIRIEKRRRRGEIKMAWKALLNCGHDREVSTVFGVPVDPDNRDRDIKEGGMLRCLSCRGQRKIDVLKSVIGEEAK